MVSYALAHEAYLKIIFHAAKHPHLPVNGVLLGKPSESDMVVIEDAVPLFHHWTNLSPMMEISLDLVGDIFHHVRFEKLMTVASLGVMRSP